LPWGNNHFIDAFIPINYDAAMVRLNHIFNAMSRALNSPDYLKAQAEMRSIRRHYKSWFHLSPWMSERKVVHVVAGTLLPYISLPQEFITMENAEQALTEASLALAAYHAAHHAYPPTLADLTPAYLPAVPRSAFDGKPLHYCTKPGGNAYLMYYFSLSLGEKGKPYSDTEETISANWSKPAPPRFISLPFPPPDHFDKLHFPGTSMPVTCQCKKRHAKQ
jgi:hypothetical protein